MKRIVIALCIALIGITGAYAQKKGDFAIGVNLGVAPNLEKDLSVTNFGLGLKVQYNITNPIRLEAGGDYWFRNNLNDMADAYVNFNYLFNVGNRFKLYPLVGVGYAKYGIKDHHKNGVLVNVGVGGEFPFTSHFSAGVEVKYQYIKDFQRIPISIGATYRF